jgi:hypothetical protein
MNRQDFQTLAHVRLEEAKVLLDAGHAAGAYYLAGYIIECALKACIARQTREYDFPPDPETVRQVYSHRLPALLLRAGLEGRLRVDAPGGSPLDKNWGTVLRWKEDSRYRTIDVVEARTLYNAIADPKHGVLVWLQQNW